MSQQLEEIFRELGISQYLDAFLDQGFDTWETILDITESDLDALGVKLGHRRKLQRRIANSRGVAPDAALVSPTGQIIEETRPEPHRPDASLTEVRDPPTTITTATVQKRKYRRHPKPDENAPERPPSAYVLFSNKMRDDLKGRNLTFTEIAKLVGENWQSLSPTEKEPFESQAQKAKDKYNQDLTEYKKTPEYRNYMVYLQEFKAKHSNSSQEKDASKRVKLSDAGSGDRSVTPNRASRSGTACSVGDGPAMSEPLPRRQRVGSTVSNDTQYSASVVSGAQLTPGEDSLNSPGTHYFDRRPEQSPTLGMSPRDVSVQPSRHSSQRSSAWLDGHRTDPTSGPKSLPSFSDMFEGRALANGTPHSAEGTPSFNAPPPSHSSGSPVPSLMKYEAGPPTLKKQQSSAGSISSASSYSIPRTPIDGPLPIHALLTGGKPAYEAFHSTPVQHGGLITPDDRAAVFLSPPQDRTPSDTVPTGYPFPPLATGHPDRTLPGMGADRPKESFYTGPQAPASHATMPHPPPPTPFGRGRDSLPSGTPPSRNGKGDANLDGMSALLRAGEIVGRHPK